MTLGLIPIALILVLVAIVAMAVVGRLDKTLAVILGVIVVIILVASTGALG